jgi:hypothetical protein
MFKPVWSKSRKDLRQTIVYIFNYMRNIVKKVYLMLVEISEMAGKCKGLCTATI